MVPGGDALSAHRGPDNVVSASPLWRRERTTEGAMPNPALRSTLFSDSAVFPDWTGNATDGFLGRPAMCAAGRDPSGRSAAVRRFRPAGGLARLLCLPALDRDAGVAVDRPRAGPGRRQPQNLRRAHSPGGDRCPRMEADMRRPQGADLVLRTDGGPGAAKSYRWPG